MPAVESTGVIPGAKNRTYLAGTANLTRGCLVVQGSDDQHVVPAGANAAAFGVVEETVYSIGEPVSIVRFGEAVGIAGAPIAAGTRVIADANGHLIPTAATGDNLVGYAISSAAVAGDYLVFFVLPGVR